MNAVTYNQNANRFIISGNNGVTLRSLIIVLNRNTWEKESIISFDDIIDAFSSSNDYVYFSSHSRVKKISMMDFKEIEDVEVKDIKGRHELIASNEDKDDYDIKMPDVGEYTKGMLLSFEKEVLGIYISGHPLEEYEELWKKHITNTTNDFLILSFIN